MGSHGQVPGRGHRSDFPHLGNTARLGAVRLENIYGSRLQQIAKRVLGEVVFTRGYGNRSMPPDGLKCADVIRCERFLQPIHVVLFAVLHDFRDIRYSIARLRIKRYVQVIAERAPDMPDSPGVLFDTLADSEFDRGIAFLDNMPHLLFQGIERLVAKTQTSGISANPAVRSAE